MIEECSSLGYRIACGQRSDRLLFRILGLVDAAIQRSCGLQVYDQQLQAAYHLCHGRLVEMKTGEGKTLTAIFATIVFAMHRQGCHVVTANSYLAERDSNFVGSVFQQLGLTVGLVGENNTAEQRRMAYACDATYTTARELGFDLLRDRCGIHTLPVQRQQAFALIDEADSILIDEARTPLIIGVVSEDAPLQHRCFQWAARQVTHFQEGVDYQVDPRSRRTRLTGMGLVRLARLPANEAMACLPTSRIVEYLENALHVEHRLQPERHYWVRGQKVAIIDEYTGRPAEGRKWQGGLHQAVEAKEKVPITPQNLHAARITVQELFRGYRKMAGMTGTIWSSRREVRKVYRRRIVRISTRLPVRRVALRPRVFRTSDAKFKAIAEEAKQMVDTGRAVLIGTRTVQQSEHLSKLLHEEGVRHQVLHAKFLHREAEIVAAAGQSGRVTVATNMAGRGTDICLEPEVVAAGGLHVVLSEMHEASRIDWQLIGRGCRQGDPGSFRVYASLEDVLVRLALGANRQSSLISKVDGHNELRGQKIKWMRKLQRKLEWQQEQQRLLLQRTEQDRHRAQRELGADPVLAYVD